MKYLIITFILLLLAVWLGIEVAHEPGYVLIAYDQWRIETSVWVAIIIVVVAFLIIYTVIRLLHHTLGISSRLKRWQRMRRYRRARRLTNTGLCELAEGNWSQAEQILVKAAKLTKYPLINYLAAARAAQGLQAFERRDNYLRLAHLSTKGSAIAVGLTQAQLQIDSQQWEQALATLQHLHRLSPQHGFIIKLLAQVYQQLRDWNQLVKLLEALSKHRLLSATEFTDLQKRTYLALLQAARAQDASSLHSMWRQLPRNCQQDDDILCYYIESLLQCHSYAEACSLIESVLKKRYQAQLITCYSRINSQHCAKQLINVEHWLKKYPEEPILLLCAGLLSFRENFLGKAQDYLQESINLAPSADGYYLLAQTYRALGDEDKAMTCYAQGLKMTCAVAQ